MGKIFLHFYLDTVFDTSDRNYLRFKRHIWSALADHYPLFPAPEHLNIENCCWEVTLVIYTKPYEDNTDKIIADILEYLSARFDENLCVIVFINVEKRFIPYACNAPDNFITEKIKNYTVGLRYVGRKFTWLTFRRDVLGTSVIHIQLISNFFYSIKLPPD